MRVGINIPYDLHQRLVPLKQHINVSQICREAIEDRIRTYEKAVASRGNEDIVTAMERVWEEERSMREIVEVDWGMLGYEDAKCWAETAQLKDWEYLHHRQEVIQRQERPRWVVPPPHLGGVRTFDERYAEFNSRIRQQDDRFLDWLYDEYGGIDKEAVEREYMLVWLALTDSAWNLFCELRGRYIEERRRKRLEAGTNRPDPTVSQELLDELEDDGGLRESNPSPSVLGRTDGPSL